MIRRYVVEGRVQGVGYRYFTQRSARRLRIVGWVQNLPGGQVEVLAAGTDDQLAPFERLLRTGPPGSSVLSLSIAEILDEAVVLSDFNIR